MLDCIQTQKEREHIELCDNCETNTKNNRALLDADGCYVPPINYLWVTINNHCGQIGLRSREWLEMTFAK